MNDYLKTQLNILIIGTVIWIATLCLALSEYPYYISGRMNCFIAAMIPTIIAGIGWVVLWVLWVRDYKEQK